MPLPHFLVVGAMKSGTTTLYNDLAGHPDVLLAEKESSPLLGEAARDRYARAFAGRPGVYGDVSTHYTMRPQYDGVVARAARWLPPDTKIVYILRDPVERAVSHYRHWAGLARYTVPDTLEAALREVPELTDWSAYATQIEPWVETFGVENVRPLSFENYVADRAGGFAGLCEWLGLPACGPPDDAVYNRTHGRPVLNVFWTRVRMSPAYEAVRHFLPGGVKDHVKRAVMAPADVPPVRPSPATRARLEDRLRGEVERLHAMFGDKAPTWRWAEAVAAAA